MRLIHAVPVLLVCALTSSVASRHSKKSHRAAGPGFSYGSHDYFSNCSHVFNHDHTVVVALGTGRIKVSLSQDESFQSKESILGSSSS